MISIVMPVYNGEKYLGEAIESVLNQDCPDWELIIVDDGSTDSTAEIANRYANHHQRIKLITKTNSGVANSRKTGVDQSSGNWITFLDGDDVILPNTISIISEHLNDNIDIVSFGFQAFEDISELKPISIEEKNDYIFEDERRIILKNILTGKYLSNVWMHVYRKSLLDRVKGKMCNGLRIAEDMMFNLETALSNDIHVKRLNLNLYGYRVNPASVMHAVNPARFDAIYNAIIYLDKTLKTDIEKEYNITGAAAFRKLLLWSTFMFNPENRHYHDKRLRRRMRKLYFKAYRYLYPYLKVYLFLDLFVSPRLSQRLIHAKAK